MGLGDATAPSVVRNAQIEVYGKPGADTTRIENLALFDSRFAGHAESPLVFEGIRAVGGKPYFACVRCAISATIARLSASTFDSTGVSFAGHGDARIDGVVIRSSPGDGLQITAGAVRVTRCHIVGSGRDAIRVPANAAPPAAGQRTVTECNLTGNAGFGVNNLSAAPVDARFNWWGDPDGPTGGMGDGVAGAVVATPFLTAPNAVPQGAAARGAAALFRSAVY